MDLPGEQKLGLSLLDTPDSLYDLAMDTVVNNLHTVFENVPGTSLLKIRDSVTLPYGICEQLLEVYQRKNRVDETIVNAFNDHQRTHLEIVKLKNAEITDDDLLVLLEHKPRSVELLECEKLTLTTLDHINYNCENLVSLKIGPLTHIISNDKETDIQSSDYSLNTPKLRKLTVWRCGVTLIPLIILKPLKHLTYLDLSDCNSLGNISCRKELDHLEVLILHNVLWLKDVMEWILNLKTLYHLDISKSNDRYGKFFNPDKVLSDIVTNLTNLVSLDISGTNLAGSGVALQESSSESNKRCDIPGLISRVDNPLQFLGLYGTRNGACNRHDIPALVISGDADEDQILTALAAYMDRPEMLTRILNDLYHLFRSDTTTKVRVSLNLVLDAMDKHLSEKHIQISGSATLFYIVKGKEKANMNRRIKKRIVKTLLNAMEEHLLDETMMRNGCLTLCQFQIPYDVIYEYEKMVLILLHGVTDRNLEGFVQRICIYLLNSLACQVNGRQKQFLGNHGAISKMIHLITYRLELNTCDDVLEVAWSTMWNVTDETPENSQRFLDCKGLDFFLACLERFPEQEELLRNMMGLLGNVAEVPHLRQYLMTPVFLKVFYNLLGSTSDGIEVSYNAAGVLAHIASDGPQAWTVEDPPRNVVLSRMAVAVESWDLQAERNINYRSFEPILSLLSAYHTPQSQHWAVWALANLTTVYPERYCELIECDGGSELLRSLIMHPTTFERIQELAAQVLHNCHNYAQQESSGARSRLSSPIN